MKHLRRFSGITAIDFITVRKVANDPNTFIALAFVKLVNERTKNNPNYSLSSGTKCLKRKTGSTKEEVDAGIISRIMVQNDVYVRGRSGLSLLISFEIRCGSDIGFTCLIPKSAGLAKRISQRRQIASRWKMRQLCFGKSSGWSQEEIRFVFVMGYLSFSANSATSIKRPLFPNENTKNLTNGGAAEPYSYFYQILWQIRFVFMTFV